MPQYREVNGFFMPFEGPPEPAPSWVPNVTEEEEREAERIWLETRRGGLMVAFAFQPRSVREEFIELARRRLPPPPEQHEQHVDDAG